MYLSLKPSAGPGSRALLANTPTLNGTVVPGKLKHALSSSCQVEAISRVGKAHVFQLFQ